MNFPALKTLVTVLCGSAGLLLGQSARADWGTVTPREINVIPISIGDVPPPLGSIFYDNSTTTGYYYPPPSGAVPCEVADDVPFTGTYLVTKFTFSYATDQLGAQEVIVKFYDAVDSNYGSPTGTPARTVDLTGLSGSTDGTLQAYTVTVDLSGQGLSFNWTNSVSPDGTINYNWVSFSFQQAGAGLLTATGGGSQDIFWTSIDQYSPYESGSFFWSFGGTPEASFYLQIYGSVVQ